MVGTEVLVLRARPLVRTTVLCSYIRHESTRVGAKKTKTIRPYEADRSSIEALTTHTCNTMLMLALSCLNAHISYEELAVFTRT